MTPEDEKSIAELYRMRVEAHRKANELDEEAKRIRADVRYLSAPALARKFDTTENKVRGIAMRAGLVPPRKTRRKKLDDK